MKTDKKNIITIGLDLSLTGTGVVVLNDGKIVEQKLIKSKPVPDGKPIDEVKRIQEIVSKISDITRKNSPNIAVIEGLAYGVKNATALTQLSALNYMVRAMLMTYTIPFIIVYPTTLKKFVTGSGASKKDVMIIEVYKRWNVTILDDNEADAYSLARVGEALLLPKITLPVFQQEVIDLLKIQL